MGRDAGRHCQRPDRRHDVAPSGTVSSRTVGHQPACRSGTLVYNCSMNPSATSCGGSNDTNLPCERPPNAPTRQAPLHEDAPEVRATAEQLGRDTRAKAPRSRHESRQTRVLTTLLTRDLAAYVIGECEGTTVTYPGCLVDRTSCRTSRMHWSIAWHTSATPCSRQALTDEQYPKWTLSQASAWLDSSTGHGTDSDERPVMPH